MDFSDLIHNLHEKWMEESAPKTRSLLDFCRFNEDALRFLTKKHLAKLENVEILKLKVRSSKYRVRKQTKTAASSPTKPASDHP